MDWDVMIYRYMMMSETIRREKMTENQEQYEFKVRINEKPYDSMQQRYRDKGAGDIFFSIDTDLGCSLSSSHDHPSSDIGIHRMSREHLKYLKEEISKFLKED